MKETDKSTKIINILSKVFFFGLVLFAGVILVSQAFAAGNALSTALIQQIRAVGDTIVISLGTVMVAFSGVQYVIAGSQEAVKEAKNTLVYAISGVAFWFLSCMFIPGCSGVFGGGNVLQEILTELRDAI